MLLLKNTGRLDSFRLSVDMAAVLRYYSLVIEPSWSGYADPRLLAFCSFRSHPIVIMATCPEDYSFLTRLDSNLRPIAIGASDWVDPQVFRPIPGIEKKFDAVMIARWTVFKRHHVLVRSLRRINDPSFQVAIIAQNQPGASNRPAILSMIDAAGLGNQVTVMEDLQPAEVNTVLNQSKVNVLLSRQEGSNRSLFEGFFAGVPGLALRNNLGIPKAYFTPKTGRLVEECELPAALLEFRKSWQEFAPRLWALRNIAPELTTAKLNRVLKELAEARQEPWTRDIVAKCNCPELLYYPDQSAGSGMPPADARLSFPPAST